MQFVNRMIGLRKTPLSAIVYKFWQIYYLQNLNLQTYILTKKCKIELPKYQTRWSLFDLKLVSKSLIILHSRQLIQKFKLVVRANEEDVKEN